MYRKICITLPPKKYIYRKAIGSSEQKGDVSEDVGVNASLLLRKLQVVCVFGGVCVLGQTNCLPLEGYGNFLVVHNPFNVDYIN